MDNDYYYHQGDDNEGDYGSGGSPGYDKKYSSRRALRQASMVLAVLSIISFLMIYISVPLGAVAIILALLSRRGDEEPGRTRTAVSLAAAGMILSTAVTGFAFYRVMTDPVLRRQMQQLLDYYTSSYMGESASEALPWLFTQEETGESLSEPVWSDDLLNDHDRLVEYFLTPRGDQEDSSSGSEKTGRPSKTQQQDEPDISSPEPVLTPPGITGSTSEGSYT